MCFFPPEDVRNIRHASYQNYYVTLSVSARIGDVNEKYKYKVSI